MANGKFSQPRLHREEEREIEEAFRQVTGQEPVMPQRKPLYAEQETSKLDLFIEDTLPPDPEPFEPEIPEPEMPEEQTDFLSRAMVIGNQVVDFCDKNRKVLLVGLCAGALALILTFIGIFLIGGSDPYDKTILNNVMIADIHVGGMTKDEAVRAVREATEQTFSEKDMVIDLAGTELRLPASQTQISLDVKGAVNAAYDYGRTGTKAEQEQAYILSFSENHIIGLLPYLELNQDYILTVLNDYAAGTGSALTQSSYSLDRDMPDLTSEDFDPESTAPVLVIQMGTPGVEFQVEAVLEDILDAYSLHTFQVAIETVDTVAEPDPLDPEAIYEEICIQPVNASVDLHNYEVIPGTYGCVFDLETAGTLLEKAEFGEQIRIPMEYIAPAILDEDMFFQDTLAEQKSSYRGVVMEKNLQAACSALNGTVINPGEEFSFNDVVGARTSEKGYRYATDLTGLEETSTLGGGVSQVSSVLYYCALVADLNVTGRTSHKLIPGYSDYGMDAMVGWKTPDLTFVNSTGFPIRIDAEVSGGQIKMAIIGTDERDYHIAMDYEITATRAPKVTYKDFKADNKEGYKDGDVVREGVTGYSVKTYQLKYDNVTGELISRDFVTSTTYQSVSKIVARVAAPEETTEATESETKPEDETQASTEPATEETQPDDTTPPESETDQTTPDTTEPSQKQDTTLDTETDQTESVDETTGQTVD